jgi:cytochrome b subunit of formate dehydrogenase
LSKVTRNYLIAAVMGLLGLVQLVSGFVLWLALPCGGRGGGGGSTFLWSRDVWLTMHNRSALLLAAIVIVHIILHWGWIVRTTRSYFGRK